MAYTEDDLEFLRKIGQIQDGVTPLKNVKTTATPTPTTESEE